LTGGVCFCNRSGEEWFFFDIDVKGGEKSRREDLNTCGCLCCAEFRREDLNTIHVGACVAINAKGGDCWQNSVNRQRMLVIDGNSEDDRQTEDKFREVNDRKQ
jgi:hypothetical protein